jgi:hypothetical protein
MQSLRRAFAVWLGRVILPSKYPDDQIPEFHDLQEVNAMLSETVKSWPSKWIQEGMAKGIEENKEEVACKMLKKGLDHKLISEVTELDIKQIEKLAKQNATKVSEPCTNYKTRRKSSKKSPS